MTMREMTTADLWRLRSEYATRPDAFRIHIRAIDLVLAERRDPDRCLSAHFMIRDDPDDVMGYGLDTEETDRLNQIEADEAEWRWYEDNPGWDPDQGGDGCDNQPWRVDE